MTQTSSGSAPVTVYSDTLGREVRSQSVGLNGSPVFKDTQYNALGQVTQVSRAYFAGGTPYWTTYTYDALGRAQTETSPDGGVVETTYNGLSTTVRRYSLAGDYDQSVTRTNNVQGQLSTVLDEGHRLTYYSYDATGNLTRVTDPEGNVNSMSYDIRGRKIAMNDPDMGSWTYEYDTLGQLRQQTDALGQVTAMSYDRLGRMTARSEPEGTSTWSYDAATQGIGKLHRVNGAMGDVRTYRYDEYGRPAGTDTAVDGQILSTHLAYDPAHGRLATLAYPTGFTTRSIKGPEPLNQV